MKEKREKIGRNAVKSDFQDVNTVIFISPSLWLLALEQAGLKEMSPSYLEKKARIRLK